MANNEQSDLIEAALNKALQEYEDHEDGDILVEWALIAYVENPDKEKAGGYPMLYSNGNMPDHRARGLFSTAMLYLGVGALGEEDD